MMSKELGLAVLLAIAIGSMRAPAAMAEMRILESNVPEFLVGGRVADTDDMRLPAGGQVKVLILPANETRIFKGPSAAQGNVKDIPFGGTRGLTDRSAPRK